MKMVDYFVIVGVVVQRDDRCGTTLKGNGDDRWSFDDRVL
jgi:hypothetical protein